MDIQVFISTINKKLDEIDDNTLDYNELTIINQRPKLCDGSYQIQQKGAIKWVDYDEKGLSKSRNLALNMASSEGVYLTDDDIVLRDNFNDIIATALIENPDYDILAFNIEGIEKEFKKMVTQESDLNLLTSMKLSSVQIVFRTSFLKKYNIKFDERFGAGAKYSMGEENIILFDAIKKGAKIKFIPETIAFLHIGNSTWFKGFNQKYLFDKGASFWRMFGILAPVYSFTYCVRKNKLFREYMNIPKAYFYTLKGMSSIIKDNKKANELD